MNDMKFDWIGWNHEPGHDKVWFSIEVGGKMYAGWGKRNGVLRFKKHTSRWELRRLIDEKIRKGYVETDDVQLFILFPHFEDEVGKYLMLAEISDSVL